MPTSRRRLLIALFGFVGTASMAKFLLRGEVIE
jgi:multisubunit Na+/H+ antiporter MnhF subunit